MSKKTGKRTLLCDDHPSDVEIILSWHLAGDGRSSEPTRQGIQASQVTEAETPSCPKDLQGHEPGTGINEWAGRWI